MLHPTVRTVRTTLSFMFLTRLLCCTSLASAQPVLLHNRSQASSFPSWLASSPSSPATRTTFANLNMHSASSSSQASSQEPSGHRNEHITLIGDSILDNKAYVRRDMPSVSQLLRKKVQDLGLPWNVTLCAIDGDVMAGVPRQLKTVPKDTTVLVLSIGGNDGLRYLGRLRSMGFSAANFERLIGEVQVEFTTSYSATLDRVVASGKKVIVCTVYKPRFPESIQQQMSCMGIAAVNSIITNEAAKRGLPVIDLATIFDQDHDYSNPIEPGVPGADKLTANIIHVVREHPWDPKVHKVYADRRYTIRSMEDLRHSEAWRSEPRSARLGRWAWEDADDEVSGAIPDLSQNDPFRSDRAK